MASLAELAAVSPRPIVFCNGCATVVFLQRGWECSKCGCDVISGVREPVQPAVHYIPSKPTQPMRLCLCDANCGQWTERLLKHRHTVLGWRPRYNREVAEISVRLARIPKTHLGRLCRAYLVRDLPQPMRAVLGRMALREA